MVLVMVIVIVMVMVMVMAMGIGKISGDVAFETPQVNYSEGKR